MKCLSCDTILNDIESTRKYSGSEEYIDLCNDCFFESEITDWEENDSLSDEQPEEITSC